MPEEGYDFTPASRLMHTDEIIQLAKIFEEQGVKKNTFDRRRAFD